MVSISSMVLILDASFFLQKKTWNNLSGPITSSSPN